MRMSSTPLSIHGRKVSSVDSKQLHQEGRGPLGWEGDSSTKSARGALPMSVSFRGLCLDVMTCREGAMD